MPKQFGQVTITVEGTPTLNIPTTMHDRGLQRFVSRKRIKRFINKKNNQIMATKKVKVKKQSKTSVKRVSGSEKIRNLYDMHVKKLGFTETQQLIIKNGYNRNTVVPVLWKHRIDIGEIDAPKQQAKKPVTKKKATPKKKKSTVKKNKNPVTKAAVSAPVVEPTVM